MSNHCDKTTVAQRYTFKQMLLLKKKGRLVELKRNKHTGSERRRFGDVVSDKLAPDKTIKRESRRAHAQ